MKCFIPILAILFAIPAAVLPATPSVHIKNDTFMPVTLSVAAGTTVTFANDDDDAHTVTATDGAFDSKGLDTGQTWQHAFAKPGTYRYFCELHPFMKGTIVVKAVNS